MPDQLRAIEADLEMLAKHLHNLIELHGGDDRTTLNVDRLRVAAVKSLEAANLVRQYREDQSSGSK